MDFLNKPVAIQDQVDFLPIIVEIFLQERDDFVFERSSRDGQVVNIHEIRVPDLMLAIQQETDAFIHRFK